MADHDAIAEIFAKARDADIEAVAGTPLFRAGKRLRGECPLCEASKGKKRDGAFSIEPQMRVFKCFGCGEGGDVIDLEQKLRGGTSREAAERLAGAPIRSFAGPRSSAWRPPDPTRPVAPRRVEGAALSSAERMAREIWTGCTSQAIGTTPAGGYFAARGLYGRTLYGVGHRLRFNPAAKWGWDDDQDGWLRAPAIVGQVVTPAGPTGGVHVTYLRPDFLGKARLDPAKRMWGPQKDLEGRPGGVWLTAPDAPGPLIVAEGIESALSAAQLLGRPCRIVAALSLGALQGGWETDAYGRIDPDGMRGNPDQPAFTWPEAGEVIVAVDRDMSPIQVKVRKLGGGTVRRRLDGEARARICAGLAVAAWKRAGANAVRAIAPGAGRDFNDELRERLG